MRTAIITGTSDGLGKAMALKLLSLGWHVHGFSRNPSGIKEANYSEHMVDVTSESAVQNAIASPSIAGGPIDLLINNAGAASMNALMLTPSSVAENLMRVNYLGAFHCMQAIGKKMVRQRSGLIINITTVAVPLALEGEAAYVASKAALDALTKVAAKELEAHGIRVIGLGFGPISTKLTRGVDAAKLTALNHRIGRPHGTSISEATDFIHHAIERKDNPTGSIRYLGQV